MPRVKKISNPNVILSIDFGGLSTRTFYRKGSEMLAHSLVMESQVGTISQDTANAFTKPNLASAAPENIAWVAIGDECRAVGYLAASQFNAHIPHSAPQLAHMLLEGVKVNHPRSSVSKNTQKSVQRDHHSVRNS